MKPILHVTFHATNKHARIFADAIKKIFANKYQIVFTDLRAGLELIPDNNISVKLTIDDNSDLLSIIKEIDKIARTNYEPLIETDEIVEKMRSLDAVPIQTKETLISHNGTNILVESGTSGDDDMRDENVRSYIQITKMDKRSLNDKTRIEMRSNEIAASNISFEMYGKEETKVMIAALEFVIEQLKENLK